MPSAFAGLIAPTARSHEKKDPAVRGRISAMDSSPSLACLALSNSNSTTDLRGSQSPAAGRVHRPYHHVLAADGVTDIDGSVRQAAGGVALSELGAKPFQPVSAKLALIDARHRDNRSDFIFARGHRNHPSWWRLPSVARCSVRRRMKKFSAENGRELSQVVSGDVAGDDVVRSGLLLRRRLEIANRSERRFASRGRAAFARHCEEGQPQDPRRAGVRFPPGVGREAASMHQASRRHVTVTPRATPREAIADENPSRRAEEHVSFH